MIFEEIRTGGCCSYVIACSETMRRSGGRSRAVADHRTLALLARAGVRAHYVIDTHTHADHFSAAREALAAAPRRPARHAPSEHRAARHVRLDDGETLIAGRLRLRVLATPATPTTRSRSCSPIAC